MWTGLLLCISASAHSLSLATIPVNAVAVPAQHRALASLGYSITPEADGTYRVRFEATGFNNLRAEYWSSINGARLNVMGLAVPPGRENFPITMVLKPDGNANPDEVVIRITDGARSGNPWWLVIKKSSTRAGKIAISRPAPGDSCPTWCFLAWMECTSGGFVERCCNSAGEIIFNDTNCAISCIACS